MKKIIVRHASDDFAAFLTAAAMQETGAEVFSVVCNPAAAKELRYLVWAKYDPANSDDQSAIDAIDAKIDAALSRIA